MVIIKQVGDVQLNKGDQMSEGLYNLLNEKTGELSFWFDENTAMELMEMSDRVFLLEAQHYIEVAELKIDS